MSVHPSVGGDDRQNTPPQDVLVFRLVEEALICKRLVVDQALIAPEQEIAGLFPYNLAATLGKDRQSLVAFFVSFAHSDLPGFLKNGRSDRERFSFISSLTPSMSDIL